ncbi:hypothetical protein GW17_00020205 [Ensete ventricosum]|nr:hypothetical protein GW17_00020205 [Ensete ventricosum]
MARLREKHRRRKERAFEEEGESGEPPRELISILFSIPIRCRHPSTIPIQEVTTRRVVNRRIWRRKDQGRRRLEQRKRQSFITSSATLRPFSLRSSPKARDVNGLRHVLRPRPKTSAAFDVFAAFFVECRRRGDEKKRRRHRRSYAFFLPWGEKDRGDIASATGKARTTRYISVRQLAGMWTGHYQAVLLKLTVGGRFRPSTVD